MTPITLKFSLPYEFFPLQSPCLLTTYYNFPKHERKIMKSKRIVTDPGVRVFTGVGLRRLDGWDLGFESG
jgi:hypothetical protein